MSKKINGIEYTDFDDILAESGLSEVDLDEMKLKTQIIGAVLKARNGKGITQKELETISGVKQPLIARIEKGNVDPQLTTLLRILQPLGMTLAVVPIENRTNC